MKIKWHEIDEESIDVLKASKIQGNEVILPELLDRRLYLKANKVLSALGAEWDQHKKVHVAEYDISAELRTVIQTGKYHNWKKDSGFFYTPDCIHECFDYFNPYDENSAITVLDPSAGRGHLMRYLKKALPRAKVYAVEINPLHMPYMKQAGYEEIHVGDFMQYQPSMEFDLILMNPPFQDSLEHIYHAYTMLKSGGTLISIAEGGLSFRKDRKYKKWETFVKDKYYEILPLPPKAFTASGTSTRTVMLSLTKFDTEVQRYTYLPNEDRRYGIIEISNVPDELYGVTAIVVSTEEFTKGRRIFPCGSGNDYRLTKEMEQEVETIIAQNHGVQRQIAA